MKLAAINIAQLFGRYNYVLNLTTNEDITIITGPNGYGKSTIIRMVYQLYFGNFYPLFSTVFSEFTLSFIDDNCQTTKLRIKKTVNPFPESLQTDLEDLENIQLNISLNDSSGVHDIVLFKLNIEAAIEEAGYKTGENDVWWKHDTSEYLTSNEILKLHPRIMEKQFAGAEEILMFLGGLNALMVADQRLFYSGFETAPFSKNRIHVNKSQVIFDAEYLKNKIELLKTKFSVGFKASMMKAFSASAVPSASQDSLNERIQTINSKIETLNQFGIAESDQSITTNYTPQTASVLSNMLADYEKVVDDMLIEINNIRQFDDLIKNSGFPDKTISFDATNGFSFTSSDGTYIAPEWLSSGEQHKLILYFQLLFKASPGMLVMIDEPELSFHVIWQMSFLEELKQIVRDKNLQLIVATHSPQIIDGKWSLTADLYELSQQHKR